MHELYKLASLRAFGCCLRGRYEGGIMKHVAGLLALVGMLTGCASQVPVAENYPYTSQKKVKAAHHWDVIARDIAQETRMILAQGKLQASQPIYVVPQPESTPFGKAFHNFLVTRLVNEGFVVTETRAGAVEVRYDTQLVRHNSDRWAYRPGTLTALVAGVLVGRNVHTWDSTEKGLGALMAAAGLDLASGHTANVTKTELLVTTSVVDGGRYVMRKSDVYYIEDEDGTLYRQIKEWSKEWKLVG